MTTPEAHPADPRFTYWSPGGAACRLLVATSAVELWSILTGWSRLCSLGWVHVRPSTIPAAALLAWLACRRLLAGSGRWIGFATGGLLLVVLVGAAHSGIFGGPAGLAGFGVAALQEELVFRLAIPITVAGLVRRAGAGPRAAWLVGIASAAVLFSVLPNHLRQADGLPGVLPFFLLSVFFGLAVRQPDAVLPSALAHLVFNMLSVSVLHGALTIEVRALATVVVLGLFTATAHEVEVARGRRQAGAEPVPVRAAFG